MPRKKVLRLGLQKCGVGSVATQDPRATTVTTAGTTQGCAVFAHRRNG